MAASERYKHKHDRSKYHNTFPNYLRSKHERRVRECFLRCSGFPRSITHDVRDFRDTKIALFIECNGTFNGVTA